MPELGSRTVLAFDFGTKSIGVAVGQEITGTASPLPAPMKKSFLIRLCTKNGRPL